MKWISIILGLVCLVIGSISILQARKIMWTAKNNISSYIKATFSTATVKEEFHKFMNEKDANIVKTKFRIGGALLSLGVLLMVIGAYVF